MTISLLRSFSEGQAEESAFKNSTLLLLEESKLEMLLLGFENLELVLLLSYKEVTLVVILFLAYTKSKPNSFFSNHANQKFGKVDAVRRLKKDLNYQNTFEVWFNTIGQCTYVGKA